MKTEDREVIQLGQLTIHVLLEGGQSGGSAAMFEIVVQPGAKVPAAHSHDGYEETIYGLEGVVTMTLSGVSTEIGAGDVLCIPRGAVHRFDNLGPVNTRFLAVVTPGVLSADYFRELAQILRAGGPPDPRKIAEVMLRHGLTPAP